MSQLIIVESPTKAKTINKFIGKDYQVESSFGHIRDLPKSSLGIDTEHNFEPKYLIPAKSKKIVNNLKKIAANSDQVILATDADREGEAIAWHLAQVLKLDKKIKRIVFHEITKKAIEDALAHPRGLDQNKVDAQQARRILDRIVGYKLSPFLWQKVARRLSAGRVQSVAVRFIVERENEIRKFQSQEYWTIEALLRLSSDSNSQFKATLAAVNEKPLDKIDIKNQAAADIIVKDLEKADYKIQSITQKETARNPQPPFITSTLQQTAANRLGFSAKKTMFVAQKLYENGYITYMRTDSVNLSHDSTLAAKDWLQANLGAIYANSAPRQFKTKAKAAQEAHEAIRPTSIAAHPDSFSGTVEEKKLYNLIWRRFVASQMPPAKIASTTVEIITNAVNDNYYLLKTSGQQLLFDGFLKLWPQKFEEKELPVFEKSDILNLVAIEPEQHFTEPPARYSDATLIKTLEEFGIGRPSTYAPIISVIQERGYVNKEKGRFLPTSIGESVNQLLTEHFPNIVDVNFSAKMEENLDNIADGENNWQVIIADFYRPFIKNLEEKYQAVAKVKKPEPEKTDIVCEQCGKPMVIRLGRFGKFLACSGFPECKNTKKIETSDKPKPITTGLKCPDCGEGEIVQRFARKRRRPFWGCSRFPQCKYATWENPIK